MKRDAKDIAGFLSEKCIRVSDSLVSESTLKDRISDRIATRRGVWTPADFLDLGSRDAVDKILRRMTGDGTLRRIARGLYHLPLATPPLTRGT